MISELALITLISTILAIVFWKLKQPPILAYIFAGILLGPMGFKVLSGSDPVIGALSDMGIAFLLFLVGLEMDFKKLKEVGQTSLITGAGQILFTGTIGYILSRLLGFGTTQAMYIAIGLTFSSTIIIVKLFSEKGELDSLHGRIAVGFLLVQDFVAIAILIMLGMLETGGIQIFTILKTIVSGVILFATMYASSKYILPKVFESLARSQELLFLSSISWNFLFSWFATVLGFPIEIGAFLAGISLAPLPYGYEIFGKIRPLRDFFVVLFFVILGIKLNFSLSILKPVLILSLLVLIGNPTIVMTLLGFMGYRKRTSFFASLATAQVSEFSLILVAMGIRIGHIGNIVGSVLTSVALVTIAISTYLITFNDVVYEYISPVLSIFERKKTKKEPKEEKKMKNHIIVFGYHRMGYTIVHALKKMGQRVLVVDFNPDLIKELKRRKISCIYGDATDGEVLERVNILESKMLISTIPGLKENMFLIYKAKIFRKPIIVTAIQIEDARELYKAGADYVIMPHFLGAERATKIISEVLKNKRKMRSIKTKHIKNIEERIKMGHQFNKPRI